MTRQAMDSEITGVKVYPFQHTDDIDTAAALVAELRGEIGSNTRLLIDCARALRPERAIAFAGLVEPYEVGWIEDPLRPRNLSGLRRLRRKVGQPLVTGETLCGIDEFRTLLDLECVDIVNPDVTACGGIAQLVELGTLAQSYGIAVAPHNYNSMTVGLAASIHAASTLKTLDSVEYFSDIDAALTDLGTVDLRQEEGAVVPTSAPGLGVELDEDWLRSHSSVVDTVGLRHS